MSAHPSNGAATAAAPAWYPDQQQPGWFRWWDGTAWTEHRAPMGMAPPTPIGQDPGMRMLLPVGRSGWAIAAGYFGLFALVLLPAPLAIILSIIAIWDVHTHEDKHGMGRAIFGLVAGVLG